MTGDQAQQFGQARNQVRKRQTEELSRKILSSMNNSFVGDETKAWLADVNENLAIDGPPTPDDPLAQLSMVDLVDGLFDDFHRYAYQYNQTEEGQIANVFCNRPLTTNKEDANILYQGSIQNFQWGLLVTGDAKSVRISFTSPEGLTDASTLPRTEADTVLEMVAFAHKEGTRWQADGKPLKVSHLRVLSKKIFARLIRVTRGEVTEKDPLTFDPAVAESSTNTDAAVIGVPSAGSNTETITYSMLSILDAIDLELEVMQQDGITALKSGGLDALTPLMKRTQLFRALKAKALSLAQDWANLHSD